uniref:BPTI/Kunitz domain-containing protein-like isoform X2 n=1 Tax=Myxine glutinosa TaxID=7769 RepID=UPI00358F9D3C
MTPFMLIPLALLCLRVDCDNSVQQRNVCSLPAVTGPCRASLRRYFFNQETMRCEKFIYGGCRGNENNFEDLENCEERCMGRREADLGEVCTLSPSKGRCTASKRRFFFNPRSMKCQRFVYGGCGGNGNNFVSKQDCENNCKPLEAQHAWGACSQLLEPGLCKAKITRFFFNPQTSRCEMFFYGGCGGNRNNFWTRFQCENSCRKIHAFGGPWVTEMLKWL